MLRKSLQPHRLPCESVAEDALFSKTKQRVIGALFGDAAHEGLTFSDILKRTSGGTGAIHRELKRFFAAGLVVQKDGTWRRSFIANREHPLYPELHALAKKLADARKDQAPDAMPPGGGASQTSA